MRKLKAFSLLLLAMTVMLFAGSISETHLSVNAETIKQNHHKKKPAKKAKKAKKNTKVRHKKAAKKKKEVKKHTKKSNKTKKKQSKKNKKVTRSRKKVTAQRKAKKQAPKKNINNTKSIKHNNIVTNNTANNSTNDTNDNNTNDNDDNVTNDVTTPVNNDTNYYQTVDGFNYPSDDHATDNATDTLNIPSGYLFSFDSNSKQLIRGTASDDSINQSHQINTFHPSTNDIKTNVNVNNISTDLQRQLSQYAANLVNDLRHKLSNNYPYTQDLTVTDKSLNAATDVANGYNNDNWNFVTKNGHDVSVLNDVYQKYGYNSYGENIAGSILTSSYINGQVTLANVKESIYGAICAMMFDDASSDWGHAANFLGIGFDSSTKQEFGVSIDKMGQIHFEIYQ